MSAGYRVPARPRRAETTVRRSRFVATLERVEDERDVRALLERIKREFPGATHHCYAYVIGPPGNRGRAGSSDAGEPRGTAGRPMLDVLLGSGIGDVAVVVSRWFGGTKLGTGGLKDAYAMAVRAALDGLETRLRREMRLVEVRCPWPYADAVRRAIERHGGEVVDERFGEGVVLLADTPAEEARSLESDLLGITRGAAQVLLRGRGSGR